MTPEQKIRLKEALKKYIKKCMQEQSVTGMGASFASGNGEQYATPNAFGGSNKAEKQSEREGWKAVPANTRFKAKTFDVEKWH